MQTLSKYTTIGECYFSLFWTCFIHKLQLEPFINNIFYHIIFSNSRGNLLSSLSFDKEREEVKVEEERGKKRKKINF